MTLFQNLRSRLSHAERIKADVAGKTRAALDSYAKDFGADAAVELARSLTSTDAVERDGATAVLAERAPELIELGQQYATASEELQPVMDAVWVKAEDRLELLRQTASSAGIPASERDSTDFLDAAGALLHEDHDGGAGRFAARRYETLPPDSPAWDKALAFLSAQEAPQDPLAALSTAELEGLLPSDERGIARTSSPGVLVQTEVAADPDLELSVEQMRAEIQREPERLSDPEMLRLRGMQPRRR